jgi:hypothetical protein
MIFHSAFSQTAQLAFDMGEGFAADPDLAGAIAADMNATLTPDAGSLGGNIILLNNA